MNKTVGVQLIIYSFLLAGLSYLVHHLAPGAARVTLITGLAGGPLCLFWGLLALGADRGKTLPVLTLVPVCFVLASQTVIHCTGGIGEARAGWAATCVTTLLLVLSFAMLMRIMWAGVDLNAASGVTAHEAKPKAETSNVSSSRK